MGSKVLCERRRTTSARPETFKSEQTHSERGDKPANRVAGLSRPSVEPAALVERSPKALWQLRQIA